jgi:hypothetical protein
MIGWVCYTVIARVIVEWIEDIETKIVIELLSITRYC